MLDLFDEWAKTTDIKPEFIIRRPIRGLRGELKKRGLSYHAVYFTNWAQRNPVTDLLEIDWNNKQNRRAIEKIKKIINKVEPDVVMTNTLQAPWAAIAANQLNIPHVWFVREYGDQDHGFTFTRGRRQTFNDICMLSALVVCNSLTLAEYVGGFIEKAKITTVYTPFNLELLEQKASEKLSSPFKQANSLKLILVGRIAPSKGQHFAAEAVGKLVAKGKDVELCIVGQPSQEPDSRELLSVIRKYNLSDRVHLVGAQTNPLAFIAAADIGVMTSSKEAFGRTTFEYMALSKPVVGANAGATPEMITDNKNGFLYKPGDINGLVKALLPYINDKKLVQKHGQASHGKAEAMLSGSYNAAALYQKIEKVLARSSESADYSIDWLDTSSKAPRGFIAMTKLLRIKLRQTLKLLYVRTR